MSAIARFQLALSIDPAHTPAYLGMAAVHREQGDFRRALEALERAPTKMQWNGCAMDFSFAIAFHRAFILSEQHRSDGFQGDLSTLRVALEEAQALGCVPVQAPEEQRRLEQALGLDPSRDRKLGAIGKLLTEVRRLQES